MLPFFHLTPSPIPGAGPKKYTHPSSCHVQQGQPQKGKQSSKSLPTGGGWGRGLQEGEVRTTAKQQAEELLSAPHLSTLTPGSLSPAHRPPDNRVGHSLSPHARQVLQASLLPVSRASCTPFVLPVSCYARAESPELHTMPEPCSYLQFPGDHRAKLSGNILNGLFPILGQN